MPSKRLWCLAIAFAVGLQVACATAHNYLDPAEPRYEGQFAAPGGRPASTWIRVVTFNVEYGQRVDRAIAALRDHPRLGGADLLLLQEMDGPGVEKVARALGLNYVYYPASRPPKFERDLGNAILSPWPILESWKLPLPHKSRVLQQARAAVGARVQIGGLAVRVYSVHLGSPFGLSPGRRRAQAETVLEDAAKSGDPVVIGGDTNSKGVGKVFARAGYAWPTEYIGSSVRGFSFDHIFARGLEPLRDQARVARDVKDASDHRPVWVLLALPSS